MAIIADLLILYVLDVGRIAGWHSPRISETTVHSNEGRKEIMIKHLTPKLEGVSVL